METMKIEVGFTTGTIKIGERTLDCQWRLNTQDGLQKESLYGTLDLLLMPRGPTHLQSTSVKAAERYLYQVAEDWLRSGHKSGTHLALKLILPTKGGYVVRSDFLEHRLAGLELVEQVKGFVQPRQKIESCLHGDIIRHDLTGFISQSVGAMVCKLENSEDVLGVLDAVESQLNNRLSFPWISSDPIPEKRVVWIEGRPDFEFSRRMWEAAWALGIKLVVIDKPGHWMQDDNATWSYLREAFLPVDISVDSGFVDRILRAVRGYGKPVDAVMSVSDARVIGAARVCEILGLPTSPEAAYILAADKYKTRENEDEQNGAFRVNSTDELQDFLRPDLPYPLIVKPCMGWGSECISKVANETELLSAVQKASDRHKDSPQRRTDVMVEPYINGPEVDANFAILNGEIVFCEIADDFPSPGDYAGGSWSDSFQETANLLPCGLPEEEQAIIRDSLLQSVLRLGFVSGTFHCEGRVRYSSMVYTTKDGREDLYPADPRPSLKPSFYLHEINARPAGYLESVATHLTYGVDYYALQLLLQIGDEARFKALGQPFLQSAQWWLVLLIVPEERAGIMKTNDPGREMLERFPDLKAAVPDYKTVHKRGSKLEGPTASALSYLAYFSVVSKKSRVDSLRLADKIRAEYKYELE